MFTDNFFEMCTLINSHKNMINITVNNLESNYTQSKDFETPKHPYKKIEINIFSSNKSPEQSFSKEISIINTEKKRYKKTSETVCLEHNCLRDVFFNIIDPLYNKNKPYDLQSYFMKTLNQYSLLLKSITSKHKQLHKEIFDNVTESFEYKHDENYKNLKYIEFWKQLLKSTIYIIHPNGKTYSENIFTYDQLNCDQVICVNVKTNDKNNTFELLNIVTEDKFKMYCKNKSIIKYYSEKDLMKMKVNDLKEVCKELYIVDNLKKQDMLKEIFKKISE